MRTITNITNFGVLLSDGTRIEDYHQQDCCESVYADWKGGFADVDLTQFQIEGDIIIEPVDGSGFRLNGQFIPCYNDQNGYYSSDLSIKVIRPDGVTETTDIVPEDIGY